MNDPLELVPGVRRMRPDDHFMVLSETDASPMHVGALLMLDLPDRNRSRLAEEFRNQLAQRLPGTPLLARLVEAPDGYDSDVWADLAQADLASMVSEEVDADLPSAVARLNMKRLDLSQPPFRAHVFPAAGAIYFKMHHCVADGIGYQEVLRRISDDADPQPARIADAALPAAAEWRLLAEARFAAETSQRADQSAVRKGALAALEAFKGQRPATPILKLSGTTSTRRSYATISLPLDRFKAAAKRMQATINDLFLACAGQGVRKYLLAIEDVPETPLVVNSARSYRCDAHGSFGNRIVALHPHLATHLGDPIERLRAIQGSMAAEMRRTPLDEALLDALEKPYGPRDRRAAFAERHDGGGRVLPGNLTLSNVPGPAGERRFMGYRQLHNYPVPIIGSGRFLNITSRRSGDNLDMGVIADAGKIPDAGVIADEFEAAFALYERL